MNYRHAFHAGNFADVLKHAVMVWIIGYLQRKPAPIRILDTHAGAGLYDLAGDEAARTGEWLSGIGRLAGRDATRMDPELAPFLAAYLELVAAAQPAGETGDGALRVYPGSPHLARALLRDVDRLQVNELQPDEAASLRRLMRGDRRVTVMTQNGWQMLKAALPPVERRGLVLIDPPFEVAEEPQHLVAALAAAFERFRTGVYLVWYPVKDRRAADRLAADVAAAACVSVLRAELDVGHAVSARTGNPRLGRCGVLVVNPPFGLADVLARALTPLARHLAAGPGAGSMVTLSKPDSGD